MSVRTLAQRNALATAYGAAAPYGALFTADPGATGTATGELTGGSPAYNRKALNWGAASASAISGAGTFDVPSGVTPAFFGACVSVTPGTADVRDTFDIVDQPFVSQGTYTINVTYTQS
ncbi:hypothetical protein G7075_19985 [Phycicoccus sp. HDW14]|uniref:phage tail fiber protein n=1 Tax=Phycicoccus sp. HDW14 TaxID=2714941 RepID=UPI001409A552|nr:hypothetical protein [Phycicoccus sp. HDW14]QIM20528.1 hypothetical protein G7075_04235 [Phycicoccus sp. HDW14]QIM22876.1 hypothetical protein G7075_19985 [Phycicoccus sp. HDW14]